MISIKKHLQESFLDFFNDYLTVEKFAEHNRLTIEQATALIELSRNIHESQFEQPIDCFNHAIKNGAG